MKLHKIWHLCIAFSSAAAFHPCFSFSEQAKPAPIRLSLTEAYACSLNVWNKEIRPGAQDVKLAEFRLILRANYLGQSQHDGKRLAATHALPGTFRLKRLDLQYLKNWNGEPPVPEAQSFSEAVDWDKLKIRTHAQQTEEVPIRLLAPGDMLEQVHLHSTLAMERNDLMRIGVFEFQPKHAGVYELHFQLQRKRQTTFEARQRVEFFCPPERPQLAVLKAGVLHQVRVPFIHMPLVASTFFEANAITPNQNLTDKIFRSVFWGLTAKRIACRPLAANLLLLDDPTAELGSSARLELANRRAQSLLRLVEQKAALFGSGSPCEPRVSLHKGETNGHTHVASSCSTGIAIQPAWPGESQVFIKSSGSEISPQWFAQENRVVPLVASLPAQRILFQPLKLKPLEDSDYIELHCENVLPASLLDCLQDAAVEITNSHGQKQEQQASREDLKATLQRERPLRLNAPAVQDFLREGRFTARLLLRTNYADTALASNTVSFTIERRSIVRDEVFALSPYDRVDLIYTLDHERIAKLSEDILQTVRDSLTANNAEVFVLITGHSDSLGEHRTGGVGRDYNLSLSFSRAVYLRKLLTDSLMVRAGRMGMSPRLNPERLNIPKPLRESVSKNVNNPVILEVFNRPNCKSLVAGCEEQTMQSFLDMLIAEKVRHFKTGMQNESAKIDGVPSAAEVRERVQSILPLMPVEVSTFEFVIAGQGRYVHMISSGFGAAAPFYRKLELSEEMQEVFCRMGFAPEEMPKFFFGKDSHPAGRVMNRRVELNMIW